MMFPLNMVGQKDSDDWILLFTNAPQYLAQMHKHLSMQDLHKKKS